jgi:prepilin-type N-terminal cleavage/methylation domain-containing protein
MNDLKIGEELGFTLIELLVVIAIIGILIGMAVFGFQGSMEASRDANRKSDLRQYQTSMEAYANKNNGLYPIRDTAVDPSSLCGILGITGACPTDPKPDATHSYNYLSDLAGTQFTLWALLEGSTNNFIVCSTGQVGEGADAPSSTDLCPL